jgi:hypothetical protein
VLDSTADALKAKPEYLDGYEDTNESVCFVLVLYGVAVDPGEIDEAVLYKVVNLVGADRKWWVVRRVKHEATHIGEKSVCHRPIVISKFAKLGH